MSPGAIEPNAPTLVEARQIRQRDALIRLTTAVGSARASLPDALRQITEAAAEALGVARVGIWRYTDDRAEITCVDLFEFEGMRHSSGGTLPETSYPAYFRALAEAEVIAADDARHDPRTAEFAASYLEPLGIMAMLDAPIHVQDALDGVLCHEHVGSLRHWTTDERTFAMAVANLVSLVLEQHRRRAAEEVLREQATLLDKARDAILVRDLQHRITYMNKSAERLYGWSLGEARGRSVRDLLYRDFDAFPAAMQTLLDTGEWVGEIEQIRRDGAVLVIEGHWSLVRDDRGEPKSVLAINTDITQRKQLEQQYLRAQRLESLGTLAGGIAHDLNNVLTPIMMSIGMLQEDEHDAERLEVLATIEASAKRGAEMIRQVLTFARGAEGRRVEVQLGPLVHDIVKIAGETFPKSIRIEERIDGNLWALQADPTQLHQVLLNLSVNARDAMPAGGRLVISAENLFIDEHYAAMHVNARVGPYLAIAIEDTGTGMPRETVDRIFEPFFTTKELGKGTGWGLPTSLAIVKGHGGFMHVYSEVGVGTRFRLYLPAHAATSQPDVPVAPALRHGNGETVLVVDDEAGIRDITRRTLDAFGYRVLLAGDGAEAIEQYVEHQAEIAVVITDMMMPGMDGAATIEALRRLNPRVRIIAASGLVGPEITATGTRHFLRKPYTARTLIEALSQVLQQE